MKAVVVAEHGGPEVLHYEDHIDPTPKADEVVVRIEAAGVNFIDTYHRTGLYPVELPLVLGSEGAGTVVAVGAQVESVAEGDRVAFSQILCGSYADLAAVRADEVVTVPSDVSLETAAAAMLQGLTAHYLSTSTFPVSADDVCLIHAGAGGVGLLLTQMAKRRGAMVITTVGTDDKAALSRRAGADHVINYADSDFGDEVESIVGPKSLDVVYDGVGRTTFERGLDLLRPRGMMVSFGNASGPPADFSPLILSAKGSLFVTRPSLPHYVATRAELAARAHDLFDWISSGDVDVLIGARFSMDAAADAHWALEGRRSTGKVILTQPG